MAELWDIYNENLDKTGRLHERGIAVPDGDYHLVVQVWIKNSEGKYLISLRSASRKSNALKWECVGGSVLAGEDSLTAALREAKEEVGVTLNPAMGHKVFTKIRHHIRNKRLHAIVDAWLFTYDGEVDLKYATTPEEVDDVKWATKEEIREIYDRGDFVKSLHYFFYDIEP